MITKESDTGQLSGIGSDLFAHSKQAKFTARRGLALELFPFIFGAGQRMSARAISDYLAKKDGVKLSAVTINKALKAAHKNWNLYFDEIEPVAKIFSKAEKMPLRGFLFQKQYFYDSAKYPAMVKAMAKLLLSDQIIYASQVLRSKWFNIDWEIRLKAMPYLEHRLGEIK
jgi:hypothetical protein